MGELRKLQSWDGWRVEGIGVAQVAELRENSRGDEVGELRELENTEHGNSGVENWRS